MLLLSVLLMGGFLMVDCRLLGAKAEAAAAHAENQGISAKSGSSLRAICASSYYINSASGSPARADAPG